MQVRSGGILPPRKRRFIGGHMAAGCHHYNESIDRSQVAADKQKLLLAQETHDV